MKKSHHSRHLSNAELHQKELTIQKAVAQAWLSRQCLSTSSSEFDARRKNFQGRSPSRFKLEAIQGTNMAEEAAVVRSDAAGYCHGLNGLKWDFNQSLWDPYEIVAVSKRLEEGLMLGDGRFSVSDVMDEDWKKFVISGVCKWRRESRNGLRNLMRSIVHSHRFD